MTTYFNENHFMATDQLIDEAICSSIKNDDVSVIEARADSVEWISREMYSLCEDKAGSQNAELFSGRDDDGEKWAVRLQTLPAQR